MYNDNRSILCLNNKAQIEIDNYLKKEFFKLNINKIKNIKQFRCIYSLRTIPFSCG